MSERGLIYFDAHFGSLLTDGHDVFFADLGHALSRDFEGIAALLDRHAAHAVVLGDFHQRLLTRSKRTPFPAAEIRAAL
ncbi:hypothetical protein BN159_0826 [Streptomyces davaonensis JCM 4913]|uniref:Uncharacterized protein n=1 Tax=Streptomyces davaonensis (strain DSM 101723 / JCM 4913 / KCC S-0913 / 768) TaxID=1214101 RepID=K4QWI3_STRDJ|nr:hypothetical protein [Streptomyces davaonensis]CCK25205.1 hypothetical protein BN159_0826 [Streptomyces davaonensis JCM 4913]